MKVKDMLEPLTTILTIQFRNKYGVQICICRQFSEGTKPYLDYKVTRWMYVDHSGDIGEELRNIDLVIYIREEGDEDEQSSTQNG